MRSLTQSTLRNINTCIMSQHYNYASAPNLTDLMHILAVTPEVTESEANGSYKIRSKHVGGVTVDAAYGAGLGTDGEAVVRLASSYNGVFGDHPLQDPDGLHVSIQPTSDPDRAAITAEHRFYEFLSGDRWHGTELFLSGSVDKRSGEISWESLETDEDGGDGYNWYVTLNADVPVSQRDMNMVTTTNAALNWALAKILKQPAA